MEVKIINNRPVKIWPSGGIGMEGLSDSQSDAWLNLPQSLSISLQDGYLLSLLPYLVVLSVQMLRIQIKS